MTRHVGIVAVSAEGAALCFRTFCVEGAELMGRHAHPEVSLHCHPLSDYMRFMEAGDWRGVADLMLSSAEKLAAVGAELLICPDNTAHQAFDRVQERSPLPWLHIAEVVAAEAERSGHRRLAVLGTRYLMEGPVYRDKLEARGIEWRIPAPEERKQIDATIFDDLVHGRFEPAARDYFGDVIKRLRDEDGCDAAVLGCTEIPILVSPTDSVLPTLDSTRLLARAALREAVGAR